METKVIQMEQEQNNMERKSKAIQTQTQIWEETTTKIQIVSIESLVNHLQQGAHNIKICRAIDQVFQTQQRVLIQKLKKKDKMYIME